MSLVKTARSLLQERKSHKRCQGSKTPKEVRETNNSLHRSEEGLQNLFN
jgi:hypothetical protein